MPEFESLLPDETLALANALAQRSVEDSVIFARIGAELKGEPYVEEPLDVQRESALGRTVLLMAMVEDPDNPVSLKDKMDASMGDKGYQHQAQSISDGNGFEIGAENVRPIFNSIAEKLEAVPGLTQEESAERFAKEMTAIYELAKENGTTAVEVVKDEDLYREAERRSSTIEEAAKLSRDAMETFNGTMLMDLILQNLKTLLPEELLEGMTDEDINELMAELPLELQLDGEAQTKFEDATDELKEVFRQTFFYKAVKTWGLEEVVKLLHTNQELMPAKPLVPTVSALFED